MTSPPQNEDETEELPEAPAIPEAGELPEEEKFQDFTKAEAYAEAVRIQAEMSRHITHITTDSHLTILIGTDPENSKTVRIRNAISRERSPLRYSDVAK